jgi:hypothetical protein
MESDLLTFFFCFLFFVFWLQKVSAIAVVDKDGHLEGALSASDLKGSHINHILTDLMIPTKDYIIRPSQVQRVRQNKRKKNENQSEPPSPSFAAGEQNATLLQSEHFTARNR